VHFVVVQPTFDKDLLVVDDTRLEPDKFVGLCPGNYAQRWPSAAELDTFLYARGGVPWRCTKNPPSGVLSIPGILAGYAFDTLGTRGVYSGRLGTGGSQSQTIPLSVLAGYRHVLWLADVPSAVMTGSTVTAMRFMSPYSQRADDVHEDGRQALAGGRRHRHGVLLPFDRLSNNSGGITRFSSLPQWNEIFPGAMVWEAPHLRSEISVGERAPGRARAGPVRVRAGAYGALPRRSSRARPQRPACRPRALASQGACSTSATRATEFLTQPNVIVEGGESVLDSLYVVQGSSVPIGTGNVAMTVYHGAEGGQCIWTGFDLWSFQRSQCIELVDGVLQGIWGLPRDPVARGPAGTPALAGGTAPRTRGFTRPTRALRLHY
jgi:hypothetical protein